MGVYIDIDVKEIKRGAVAILNIDDVAFFVTDKDIIAVPEHGDPISRQAAIDALNDEFTITGKTNAIVVQDYIRRVNNRLHALPSAQPEPLTDKEQRIFLAAMGREEDVCKQVDAEWRDCREPYEDSLVRTCREIIRKVKGALWTI